jgi:hypothetical protein
MISYAMPIAGSKNMYTSGWNVNQNKCWYAIGSPPIAGLKKPVTPNLSVYVIIMAAEKVGIATIIINDCTSIDHAKRDIFIRGRSGCFILRIVTTKLIEPSIDEIPSIFMPKIHISVAGPGARIIEYGGYAVQPTSENPSQIKAPATGIIQNATAFSFGHAISL